MLILLTLVARIAGAAELDNAVKAMSGNEVQFTQRFTPKGFKTAQTESGSVVFGALPQMRWSYAKPEQKLFVFDGANSWFYIPADKQVTVGRIDDARKRELPFLLLGDSGARDKYFILREARRGNTVVATLQPRDNSAMIRNVNIVIAATTHLIARVDYTDREGNHTSFDFSGYRGSAAKPDAFRFTPPAGVHVVQAQ
jgi:chaperone LolA